MPDLPNFFGKGIKPQKKLICPRSESTTNSTCSSAPEVWFYLSLFEENAISTPFIECGQTFYTPKETLENTKLIVSTYPESTDYEYLWKINGVIQDSTEDGIEINTDLDGANVYEITLTNPDTSESISCSTTIIFSGTDYPNIFIFWLTVFAGNSVYPVAICGSHIYVSKKNISPYIAQYSTNAEKPVIDEDINIIAETETSTTYELTITDSLNRTASCQFTVHYPFEQLEKITVSKLIVDGTPVCCGGTFNKTLDITSICKEDRSMTVSGQIITNVYTNLTYLIKINDEIIGEGSVSFEGTTGITDTHQYEILKKETPVVIEFYDACSDSDEPVETCSITVHSITTKSKRASQNQSIVFLS